MEPVPGFRAKGSFGVPLEMQKDLDAARRKAPAPEPARVEPTPEAATESVPVDPKAPKELTDAEREAEYVKFKVALEKELMTSVTVDDIKDYVFRGRITKEVEVIPGVMKATFQTLNPTEYLEIDKRVAAYQDEGIFTSEGLSNQRALVTLSYVWIAANGKPLSGKNEPTKREDAVRKCGVDVIDSVVRAHEKFKTLVTVVMKEKSFIKKP